MIGDAGVPLDPGGQEFVQSPGVSASFQGSPWIRLNFFT